MPDQLNPPSPPPTVGQVFGPVPKLEFHALILADQRHRWRQGVRVAAEFYLERLPQLGNDREFVLDLVTGEIELRTVAGETFTIDEYHRRFPTLAGPLTWRLALQKSSVGTMLSNPNRSIRTLPEVDATIPQHDALPASQPPEPEPESQQPAQPATVTTTTPAPERIQPIPANIDKPASHLRILPWALMVAAACVLFGAFAAQFASRAGSTTLTNESSNRAKRGATAANPVVQREHSPGTEGNRVVAGDIAESRNPFVADTHAEWFALLDVRQLARLPVIRTVRQRWNDGFVSVHCVAQTMRQLPATDADMTAVWTKLADDIHQQSAQFYGSGRSRPASDLADRAVSIREAILADHPNDAAIASALAADYMMRGEKRREANDLLSATADFGRANALLFALVQATPRNGESTARLALCEMAIAHLDLRQGRFDDAKLGFKQAMGRLDALGEPDDVTVNRGVCRINLGHIAAVQRQPRVARDWFDEAEVILRPFANSAEWKAFVTAALADCARGREQLETRR